MVQARQALNALLGLPPAYVLALSVAADPSRHEALRRSPEELTRLAIGRRPDLAEIEARYQVAEAGVQLAVAQQLPALSLGTGIGIRLPVFSRWGRPAIETARARRLTVGRELAGAVHRARQEIASAHTLWNLAARELDLVESELLPNAERNLELAQEAFREGELTLLETLALQSGLVEARTRHTEARADTKQRAWALLAACGLLLDGGHENSSRKAAEVTR